MARWMCESVGMRRDVTVEVSAADRARLEAVVADRNSPQKHVWRAKIILATAEGLGTAEIMRRSGKSKPSVWRWQERFMTDGVDGLLRDKTRPSRIPPLQQTIIDHVIALTATEPPHQATHWTAAAMAKATGISVSSVQRIWRAHKLQPHRGRSFKLSTDPQFAARLRDIAGLYIDPPAHAVVLSVDEKSQIQALDRTQPGLPLKNGRDHDARLQKTRHDDALRRARRTRGQGHRPLHAAPPPSGVHPVSERHRGHRAGRQGRARHPRQLRHAQTPEGQDVAGAPPALRLPLHADLLLLAQRRRGLLRQAHQAPSPTRRLPLDHRAPGCDQPLHRRGQS